MNKYLLIFTLPLFSMACADQTTPDAQEETPANLVLNDSLVHLTHHQVAQGNITYGHFSEEEISETLTVSGSLVIHPENMAHVTAFAEGIIEYIAPVLNEKVHKGQTLVRMRKPDLLDIQEHYLNLKNKLPFLQSEYERYKMLKENNATAAKNFEKAESEYRAASEDLKVLTAKLKQYGIETASLNGDNLQTSIALAAPISGTVVSIQTSLGASVQPGDVLMEIANLDRLHADLWVYEKDLPKVKVGQSVQLGFPALPGQKFQGSIYSIDKKMDEEKRAVKAHASFPNAADGSFVEGAFVQGEILLSQRATSLALPETAVAREGEGYFIFYKQNEDENGISFVKVPVNVVASRQGTVAIRLLENVPPNAQVVVGGAYYIYAQSSMAGMEQEH